MEGDLAVVAYGKLILYKTVQVHVEVQVQVQEAHSAF